MKKQMLDRLALAAEARYLREHERIRAVMAEEADIAAQLALLDDQLASIRAAGEPDQGYRSVGADIQWQAWETRTRRMLNQKLARARAKRLSMMDGLRAAFGRKEAVAALKRDHAQDMRRARSKTFLENLCRG